MSGKSPGQMSPQMSRQFPVPSVSAAVWRSGRGWGALGCAEARCIPEFQGYGTALSTGLFAQERCVMPCVRSLPHAVTRDEEGAPEARTRSEGSATRSRIRRATHERGAHAPAVKRLDARARAPSDAPAGRFLFCWGGGRRGGRRNPELNMPLTSGLELSPQSSAPNPLSTQPSLTR